MNSKNYNSSNLIHVIDNNHKKLEKTQYVLFIYRFNAPTANNIDRFNQAVVEMIAEDLQPLSVVENRGFRKLVNLLDPQYVLPSRRTIGRKLIPELFESTKSIFSSHLSEAKNVSITTDIWTSMNTDSFITMTAHFLMLTLI